MPHSQKKTTAAAFIMVAEALENVRIMKGLILIILML